MQHNQTAFTYNEYLPHPALQPYVECYWQFEYHNYTSHIPVQHCLPLGTMEIIVQVNGNRCMIADSNGNFKTSTLMYVTGVYTGTALWLPGQENFMFGIRLKPEGMATLFKTPPRVVVNEVEDATNLLGNEARQLCDNLTGTFAINQLIKIAEDYLLNRLNKISIKETALTACHIIRHTGGNLPVNVLSNQLNISRRQLERLFINSMGITLKTYQRIVRFRNAYSGIRKLSAQKIKWAQLSAACGYADQAHLIREFKSFTGAVPTLFEKEESSFFQTLEVSAAFAN